MADARAGGGGGGGGGGAGSGAPLPAVVIQGMSAGSVDGRAKSLRCAHLFLEYA